MNSSIFLPKKINVGFQERSDTYTKKLAYVIYYDEKGTLRKETSWNSWRDKDIDPIEYDNVPTSGFVLNKKVGGYSSGWNFRQSYVRIYDPRDFEFEITIANLLYILEYTNSIKGKGLEGDFIFGWDGKDLLLIPTSSPDYVELTKYNAILFNNETIKAKELILGATYKTKDNRECIYMGKFDAYEHNYYEKSWTNKGKEFFFCTIDKNGEACFNHMKSINKRFISVIDDKCIETYAELFDELEGKRDYSPVDNSKDVIIPYELKEFEGSLINKNDYVWHDNYYDSDKNKYSLMLCKDSKKYEQEIEEMKYTYSYTIKKIYHDTIEELYATVNPVHLDTYLKNGRFHRREY